jgi:hypothetical protein
MLQVGAPEIEEAEEVEEPGGQWCRFSLGLALLH